MGSIRIIQVDDSRLSEFDNISISFQVTSVYDVIEEQGQITLVERTISNPYVKDYDQLNVDSSHSWSGMNTNDWGIFLAVDESQHDKPVGGALVAMPECALWDLRVSPTHRRQGVGKALLERALQWSKRQGVATRLNIETQNTNVSACQFYAAMGAKLDSFDRNGYQDDERVKHEVRLNWFIDLSC